jgi:glycosyltransferase involved in cell wall biosynthesis
MVQKYFEAVIEKSYQNVPENALMKQPFFSVVVPTFNRECQIEKTIMGVIGQVFTSWELLIVDDGSTDDTLNLVKQISDGDDRMILLSRPLDRSKGANACRNIGIENASGAYVAFLDSDDFWLPEWLKHVYEFVRNEMTIEGVYSNGVVDDGEKKTPTPSRQFSPNETVMDFLMSPDVFTQTSTFVVKTECAKEVKFDESLQRHQDLDFFIRFDQKYSWCYLDVSDVETFWEKGRKRRLHYPSMIVYYDRYKHLITSDKNLFRYLWGCFTNAIDEDSPYISFYQMELKKVSRGLRGLLFIKARIPVFYYKLWKLLRGH